MLRRSAIVLALVLALPLVACQPAEREVGGDVGPASRIDVVATGAESPGDHFEEAYTDMAEAHISLVQGDWKEAADRMKEVRENLDEMKQARGGPLPTAVTNRISELQRQALHLDQMISNRNPAAVEQSRALMNTFTRESSLAKVGREGGGAGQGRLEHR